MKKKVLSVMLGVCVIAGLLAGCGTKKEAKSEKESKGTISIAFDSMTEKTIFGEVYALALEDAGYTVKREEGLSVAHDSLLAGEVDMVLDYTGTAYTRYMINEPMYDSAEMTKIVQEYYAKENNVAVLNPSAINNSYGICMLKTRADELGIKTFQDLQKQAEDLVWGDWGFLAMPTTGRARLEELYGPFNFKQVIDIDMSLSYDLLDNGDVDVIPVCTTDANLLDDKYFCLDPEKDVWCEYLLVPFVRQEVLDKYPEVEDILNNVSAKLDNRTSIELIHKVDVEHEDYHDVAEEYYKDTFK